MRDESKPSTCGQTNTSRRALLRGFAATIPAAVLASPWQRLTAAVDKRELTFYHTHTLEQMSVVYHADGQLLPNSIEQINHFLRDFRTDEVHEIDPVLLDFLHSVSAAADYRGTFEVISGYRSPKTNAMLRRAGSGVAKRSLHMQGRAIDVRMTGVDTKKLRKIAVSMKLGGVGYYPRSNFVHLDTGRVRTW